MSRNTLILDTKGFTDLIEKLDGLGGDVKKAVTQALERAGRKVGEDTAAAVQPGKLPAKGKYSQGDTAKSIEMNPKVEWSGSVASIGVGFDYDKPGAGGYLISGYYYRSIYGTPRRMDPASELRKMYTGKKYMNSIRDLMALEVKGAIAKAMEG